MESELRARITAAQASLLRANMPGWSRPRRVVDIVFGLSGVDSMQEDGWVIRLRRSDAVRRLEYKAAVDGSSQSWEELGIVVDNLAVTASILAKIGLKPGLVIDRQRCVRRLENVMLSLDEVKFLGTYLEIEAKGDLSDVRGVIGSLADTRFLPRLSFDSPPYGQMLRQKRAEDPRIVAYEKEALEELANDAIPDWRFEI